MSMDVKKENEQATTQEVNRKSGLHKLEAGEVLFSDGEGADSLYIIQKGQLRLFKPKGRGYIELAVLRTGEVLGEMAYFDDDGSGGKRSCSAEAIVGTEVIEISFKAFTKTMSGLNPWFKTIINTLASRLRKANLKVKELDSNSVASYGPGSGYHFFRSLDVVKLLSCFFLVYKSHGEPTGRGVVVTKQILKWYIIDIYNILEAKFEEFLALLEKLGMIIYVKDEKGQMNLIQANNINMFRSLLVFANSQRVVADEKKINVTKKCEKILDKLFLKVKNIDDTIKTTKINLTEIFEELKSERIDVELDDLHSAKSIGMVGDTMVGEKNTLFCNLNIDLVKKNYFPIKFTNAVKSINEIKEHSKL